VVRRISWNSRSTHESNGISKPLLGCLEESEILNQEYLSRISAHVRAWQSLSLAKTKGLPEDPEVEAM